jgi:hypothetical protein
MKQSNVGYYTTNGQTFINKTSAIYEANKTKADIDWYFHDDVLNALDWTAEPNTSLNEFYRQRAQQLRSKYDYLVLFFSGGADSTNMVYSFLKNGIHVDEIVAGAPVSGLNNWNDTKAIDASNTISETRLAQLPELKRIAEEYPIVKVTVHDYFEDMLEYKTDEWLWKSGSYIHPTFAARYSLERDEYKHLRALADSGKSIGLVYGLDKPCLAEHNNSYYLVIKDLVVCNGFQSLEHPMATVELFYYNADVPLLMIKQAHVTARYISRPENVYLYNNIYYNTKNPNSPFKLESDPTWHHGRYERGIVPAIYPILEKQVFQANKPQTAFFAQHDAWVQELHKDSSLWQMMTSDFKMFINGIDQKYFVIDKVTKLPRAFHGHVKFFNIGHTSKFKTIIENAEQIRSPLPILL